MTKRRSSRAFTIAEVIIAMTITGIMMAALASALSGSLFVYTENSEIAAINQTARVIMDRMNREMRMANNVDCATDLLKIYPNGPSDPHIEYSLNANGKFYYTPQSGGTSHELLGSEDDVSVQSFTINLTQVVDDDGTHTTLARIELVLLIDGQSYSFTTSAAPRKNLDK